MPEKDQKPIIHRLRFREGRFRGKRALLLCKAIHLVCYFVVISLWYGYRKRGTK